jgi:hypothetical protein
MPPLKPLAVLSRVSGVLTVLSLFISAAEDMFDGDGLGEDKKKWVLDQLMPLLKSHLGDFWGGDMARAVINVLIDVIVQLVNKTGKF